MTASLKRSAGVVRKDMDAGASQPTTRRAIGYVRSLDGHAGQRRNLVRSAAIGSPTGLQGLEAGPRVPGRSLGWEGSEAGTSGCAHQLEKSAEVLVVVKFDRLSCRFAISASCTRPTSKMERKELVAIRESIRLDSALGRALINILLVFAQMEREATGERTREAIHHIRQSGYHFGKVPYGKKTIPAPDNPRMKILVDDEDELAVIAQLKAWAAQDVGITEMAKRLNAAGTPPPQGARWTKSLIYNLRLRLSHIQPRPINERPHTDEELKQRMVELRKRGHTQAQIATILNELGFLPLKGRRFTESSVRKLMVRCVETQLLTRADSWRRCSNACGRSMKQRVTTSALHGLDIQSWRRYRRRRATRRRRARALVASAGSAASGRSLRPLLFVALSAEPCSELRIR